MVARLTLAIALAVGWTAWPSAALARPAGAPCPLIRVVDGDTLRCRLDGRDTPVRLLRIDTPERGRPGYREATEALGRCVRSGPLRVEPERPGRWDRDRYGRALAYVYGGARLCNVEQVRSGWSRFWTRYGAGRLAARFRAAEAEARREGAGLWRGPGGEWTGPTR